MCICVGKKSLVYMNIVILVQLRKNGRTKKQKGSRFLQIKMLLLCLKQDTDENRHAAHVAGIIICTTNCGSNICCNKRQWKFFIFSKQNSCTNVFKKSMLCANLWRRKMNKNIIIYSYAYCGIVHRRIWIRQFFFLSAFKQIC